MSIIIKTNAMKYKDSNGEYQGFNAVAQESTDQQLASIASAGQAQISAVQQKGAETLASIPSDYTALSGNVNDLKSALNETVEPYGNLFDKENPDLRELYINPNLGVISGNDATPARLIVVPIENNKSYVVNLKFGASTKRVATTIDNPAHNSLIDNCQQFVGEINNCVINNTTGNYLCIQLFVNADTDKTAANYYDYIFVNLEGQTYTALDRVARNETAELNVTLEALNSDVDNLKNVIENVTEVINLFDKNNVDLRELYINVARGQIGNVDAIPARLIVIPIEHNTEYVVNLPFGNSTKRIATTINNPADSVYIENGTQFVGFITNYKITNTTGNYLCIQLFVNNDTDKTATNYYDYLTVTYFNDSTTAIDRIVRKSQDNVLVTISQLLVDVEQYGIDIEFLKRSVPINFYTENLTGISILNSVTDISVDDSTWDYSSDFHDMVETLCNNSDGYITRTLMGQDAHQNNMYYYKTHPKNIYYGCERESVAPAYPPTGGYTVKPFRIILTSNIHYREKNGNYVVYNLLNKMLSENSEMLKWFKNNTEIIWIPCCCPTSNEEDGYLNADGQNVNRSFPITKNGTATCPEATLIKGVFDEYGEGADIHLDLHTFGNNDNFVTWIFTDSVILGARGARVAEDVLQEYRRKYPYSQYPSTALQKSGGSFVNTPTTSSYYMEAVYGVPSGTIEIQRAIAGGIAPASVSVYTTATAILYDLVTQTIVAMAR